MGALCGRYSPRLFEARLREAGAFIVILSPEDSGRRISCVLHSETLRYEILRCAQYDISGFLRSRATL